MTKAKKKTKKNISKKTVKTSPVTNEPHVQNGYTRIFFKNAIKGLNGETIKYLDMKNPDLATAGDKDNALIAAAREGMGETTLESHLIAQLCHTSVEIIRRVTIKDLIPLRRLYLECLGYNLETLD